MASTLLKRLAVLLLFLLGCFDLYSQPAVNKKSANKSEQRAVTTFKVEAEAFADIQVLRYQVPRFDQLSLQQKRLAFYLSEAALSGRDIIYDQRSKYGLLLRKTLETAYTTYKGNKNTGE